MHFIIQTKYLKGESSKSTRITARAQPCPREVVAKLNWAESNFHAITSLRIQPFFLASGEEQGETVVFTGYAITRLEMLATQATKV